MADTTRTLQVVLSLKDSFSSGTRAVLSGLRTFGTSVRGIFSAVGSAIFNVKTLLLGLGGGLILRQLTHLVTGVAKVGEELKKASQQTGLSVELLSKLKFAAEQSGTSLDTLAKSVGVLAKNIGEIQATGKGEAATAIGQLSNEFQALVQNGAPMEDLLEQLVKDFDQLETAQERAFIGQKLFGRGFRDIVPLLREGATGLRALMKDTERLGLVWSAEEAEKADAFGDALDRVFGSIKGATQAVIKPFLGPFKELLDKLTEFFVEHRADVINFARQALEVARTLLPSLSEGFSHLATSIESVAAPFLKLNRLLLDLEQGRALDRLRDLRAELDKANQAPRRGVGEIFTPERVQLIQDLKRQLAETEAQIARIDARVLALGNVGGGTHAPVLFGGVFDQAEIALAAAEQRERERRLLEAVGAHQGAFQGPPGIGVPGARLSVADLAEGGGSALVTDRGRGRRRRGGTFDEAGGVIEGLTEGLKDLRDEWTRTASLVRGGVHELGGSIVNNITTGFIDAARGVQTFGQAVKTTTAAVLQDLAQIILRLSLMRALGFIAGAITGPSPSGALAASKTASSSRGFFATAHTSQIGSFQHGGLAVSPQLAFIAEREPELITPVSKLGRSGLGGGRGGGDTVIIINAIDTQSFDQALRSGAARQKSFFSNLHAASWQEDRRLRGRFR